MPRAAPRPATAQRRPRPGVGPQSGVSLIELMLVLVVLGLVTSMALPRFAVASEEARVDAATAVLRSIWLAERMHWLEHRTFTDDLDTLVAGKFIEGATATVTKPFDYDISAASATSFSARAVRKGSSQWSGTLSIDALGAITGTLTGPGGRSVAPIPD